MRTKQILAIALSASLAQPWVSLAQPMIGPAPVYDNERLAALVATFVTAALAGGGTFGLGLFSENFIRGARSHHEGLRIGRSDLQSILQSSRATTIQELGIPDGSHFHLRIGMEDSDLRLVTELAALEGRPATELRQGFARIIQQAVSQEPDPMQRVAYLNDFVERVIRSAQEAGHDSVTVVTKSGLVSALTVNPYLPRDGNGPVTMSLTEFRENVMRLDANPAERRELAAMQVITFKNDETVSLRRPVDSRTIGTRLATAIDAQIAIRRSDAEGRREFHLRHARSNFRIGLFMWAGAALTGYAALELLRD